VAMTNGAIRTGEFETMLLQTAFNGAKIVFIALWNNRKRPSRADASLSLCPREQKSGDSQQGSERDMKVCAEQLIKVPDCHVYWIGGFPSSENAELCFVGTEDHGYGQWHHQVTGAIQIYV